MNTKWNIIPLSAATILATGLLFNASAQAAYINDDSNMLCTTDSVTLDSVTKVDGSGTIHSGSSIEATSCVGMILDANDDSQGASSPNPNIGELEDGFMNSEVTNTGQLDPLSFIEVSDLQDLDGDGDFTDPGWIHLAHIDADNTVNGTGDPTYSSIGSGAGALNLDDVLDITFDCDVTGCLTGTWSITTTSDILDKITPILGASSFDHLAFVFKGGKSGVGIYDFDFIDLLNANAFSGPDTLDFVTPYAFSGTWNMYDLIGPNGQAQNYSHVNIWARDPAGGFTDVPEPATIALFGLGLLGLAGMRKRKMA